jgi:hypothetical protein
MEFRSDNISSNSKKEEAQSLKTDKKLRNGLNSIQSHPCSVSFNSPMNGSNHMLTNVSHFCHADRGRLGQQNIKRMTLTRKRKRNNKKTKHDKRQRME